MAAGYIIGGFSRLIMSGDFVIGLIVFAILITVNFVVITKGATRIAEVGARFTLDAIPGKQMAIDADLSAGLIDDKEARRRRRELEEESAFFGSMDGASKFVRGDAIVGLVILAVNIFGGIVIGVTRHNMPWGLPAMYSRNYPSAMRWFLKFPRSSFLSRRHCLYRRAEPEVQPKRRSLISLCAIPARYQWRRCSCSFLAPWQDCRSFPSSFLGQ
jgi:FHIPEP family